MNFVATRSSRVPVAMKSPAACHPRTPAGDTYMAVLVRLLEIGDKLKIQSVAMKHARNCAAKQDWSGVQLALAMLCACAQDIRKIAATANQKIEPDMDDASNVYGEAK